MTKYDVYPIVIEVEYDDGTKGRVSIKWLSDSKKFIVECENATLDEGAKKFFDHLKDYFADWLMEELNDRTT